MRKYCAFMFKKKRNYCYHITSDNMNELKKLRIYLDIYNKFVSDRKEVVSWKI